MSTAGSVRSGAGARYGPPASGVAGDPSGGLTTTPRRVRVFRWQGIVPLAIGLLLVGVGWLWLGERIVRGTMEEAGTKALGTQVDIAQLSIDELHTTVELRGVAVADPFDPRRNLVEANRLRLELEPEPLLLKKIVVRRLTIGDVHTGTVRRTPARPVTGDGFAPRMLREMDHWAKQFDIPLLSLTPIDTFRSIVLDPTQLASVRAALALAARVDSLRVSLERGYAALGLQETLDTSRALVIRLQGANVRMLGIDGARSALADLRRTAARVDSARRRVDALGITARTGVDTVQIALRSLDDARKSDYAFARSLLALPAIEAPDMGAALFGKVTIDKFQQALYWMELAREYAPPGLLAKEVQGPTRLRRAGSTIHFAIPKAYPRFLLRRADLDLTVTDGPLRGSYVMAVADVTTEPALVGRPTVFALRRTARGGDLDSLRATGMLDHTGARPREVLTVLASGMRLPPLTLPVLPFKADPGRGKSELHLALDGDNVSARWAVHSGALAWISDSSRARPLNTIESLIARVLTGVGELELGSELNGSLRSPKLTVRSNLDRVIADRLRAVAGQEVLAAEMKARTQVDRLVDEKSAPIKARIAELRAANDRRVAEARSRLEAEQQKLDAQLKALTGGILGLPKLPGT